MHHSNQAKKTNIRNMVVTSLMMALTIVMFLTPIGTISIPPISVTIAHLPAIITTLTLGLGAGLVVSFTFGATSLILALTMPVTPLDPLFVNPLLSILPRMLIPFAAYYVYKGLILLLRGAKPWKSAFSAAVAIALANLTNTFGVYTMLYFLYAQEVINRLDTNVQAIIIGAISTTTAIKCVIVVVVGTPLVMTLRLALRQRGN